MKIRITANDPCVVTIDQTDDGLHLTVERTTRTQPIVGGRVLPHSTIVAHGGQGGVGVGASGGSGGIVYGGNAMPDPIGRRAATGSGPGDRVRCPVCGERHNPKEHAGGDGSPTAGGGRVDRPYPDSTEVDQP